MSDDLGPTSHNTIEGNLVEDNESDCGITIVGHNAGGVNTKGVPQPSAGGVFDNLVTGNVVLSDGTTGEGGGILLAGAASYDNTITDNEITGNGLAGVTIHEHGVDALSGDVISGNWFGTNDITGDPGTPDQVTTGVFVERDTPKFPTVDVTVKKNTIVWTSSASTTSRGTGIPARQQVPPTSRSREAVTVETWTSLEGKAPPPQEARSSGRTVGAVRGRGAGRDQASRATQALPAIPRPAFNGETGIRCHVAVLLGDRRKGAVLALRGAPIPDRGDWDQGHRLARTPSGEDKSPGRTVSRSRHRRNWPGGAR